MKITYSKTKRGKHQLLTECSIERGGAYLLYDETTETLNITTTKQGGYVNIELTRQDCQHVFDELKGYLE